MKGATGAAVDPAGAGRRTMLVIHDTLSGWGSEKNLEHVGRYAPAEVFEVSYLLTGPTAAAGDDSAGLSVFHLGAPRLRVNRHTQPLNFMVKLVYALAWFVRRRTGFRYLLVTNPEECILAFLARMLLRMPSKLLVYNQIPLSPATQTFFMRLALQAQLAIMRRCDGVICLSPGLRDRLVEEQGVGTRTWVVPSCIDREAIAALAREDAEEGWLKDDGRRTLLWVGRLSNQQKRVDVLLRAIALLREQGVTGFKALLVGDGEDQASLQELARTLGLVDQTYFLGYRRNPYPYYALSDLFVLSSDLEGFGNVIVEAMACGLPVIATDCHTGPAEILGGGKWGVLVPPADPVALAREVRRVFEDDLLRDDLARRSLARARDFQCITVLAALRDICGEVEGDDGAGSAP